MRLAVLATSCLLAAGCARAATPQQAVQRYAGALASSDQAAAERLLSDDARERYTGERGDVAFEQRVAAGEPLVEALRDAADQSATVRASLPYGDFDAIELELRDDRWVITSGVADLYGRSSPRDCYRALVRAIQARDEAALWELMPGAFRAEVTRDRLREWMEDSDAELTETADLLVLAADAPIQEVGDRATLRYGARILEMRREGAGWVVWDFE